MTRKVCTMNIRNKIMKIYPNCVCVACQKCKHDFIIRIIYADHKTKTIKEIKTHLHDSIVIEELTLEDINKNKYNDLSEWVK